MNGQQVNGHSSLQNGGDEDFELMGDMPKEDPVIVARRRMRNNEISKKLGSYLLKGYCMLSDACPQCDCILLRTPDRQLLCVGCAEVDVDVESTSNQKDATAAVAAATTTTNATGENETRLTSTESAHKKKDRVKSSKRRNKKSSVCESTQASNENRSHSVQLENKLKWAVNELSKSENPNRINAMCTVIVKLTESIKALKEYETTSA